MADRMASEIWIGGTISPAMAEGLYAVVRDTGASLEWGGGVFAPRNVEELLEANDDVPGILAHMENGHLAEGAVVNRCDLCQRYPSDEAAFEKLRELGHVPP